MTFPEQPGLPAVPEPEPDRAYLLYLHVPFCVALCPFCSFHRLPFREDLARGYFESLRREIELATDAGFHFDELYVGGGTPTVLPGELLQTIRLARRLHAVNQVSVETNPDDLDTDPVRSLPDAGVSRLSVGVQTFDDRLLAEMQRLDRYGSGESIRQRVKRATGVFKTLNVDMIFNLPHQDDASLRRDLDILIDDIGVGQVSFYPLMAAPATRASMRPYMGDVDFAREQGYYELIVERMLAAGYQRSSAWCFDRDRAMRDEYIVDRDDYLGLGSGAFSYLGGTLLASSFSIGQYRALVDSGRVAAVHARRLSPRDQMRYVLLMRLFAGELDLRTTQARFGSDFAAVLRPELTALRALGALRTTDHRIALTEPGYYLWVVLMREFFTGLNRLRDEMRREIPAPTS